MTTTNNIKQQKEMKKHLFFWASLLVAGLALTACGGDDADDFSDKTTPVAPTGKQKWTVTVGAGVMTRGLNDDLTPNWSTDDEVYVYYGSTLVGTLKPTAASNSGSVTLTGELDEANYSTVSGHNTLILRYKYGATGNFSETPNYEDQNGTIADIAENYDYMNATVTIKTVDNTAKTLSTDPATFQNLQSIFELTFTEPLIDGDVIQIDGGDLNVDVTPGAVAAGTPVYVAVPFNPSTTSGLSFVIAYQSAANEEVYYADPIAVGKTLQNGKHYKATVNINAVRLWEGGPCWAVKNIGASDKYDEGSLFAWGETETKATYTQNNYKYYDVDTEEYTKYINNPPYTLELADDAAYVNCGSSWRMPTWSEFQALIDNTTMSWDSSNKVYTFTGNTAGYVGRSIFLPASNAGDYWSSTSDSGDNQEAQALIANFYGDIDSEFTFREYSGPIRPVRP